MSNIEQVIIRTPQQQGFRNPQVIFNIRELREWLDTLPLLKPASTIVQLTYAIEAFNRQQLNSKKRQQLLHEYRQVILQINPSLNLNALKRLSLTEKERVQLQLQSTALCMALADGYRIIIKQALEEGIAQKPGVMFEPLYLALEALSLALLNCFRAYKTAPQNLYQDIHQLYLLAEHGRCPAVADMFDNTRTTLTTTAVRFLAWNMPYHVEHHSAPNVPFHHLPDLHAHISEHLRCTSQGYTIFARHHTSQLK